MRKTSDDSQLDFKKLLLAGGASGLMSFIFKCIPDMVFIKQIDQSLTNQKSIAQANSRYQKINHFWKTSKGAIAWDFHYRILMGFVNFPIQRLTEQHLIHHHGKDQLTLYQKAIIGSFAGWFASMIELTTAHPLDSMRATLQTNPTLFNRYCGIPYFLQHQSQLRAGMGAGILRNTCSNPPAWCAKTLMETHLSENKELSDNMKNAITSLTFALVRFMAGYPLDVIKTAVQCDIARQNNQRGWRYAIDLTRRQIKKEGLSFLTTGFTMRLWFSLASASTQLYVFNHILAPKNKSGEKSITASITSC